MDRASHSRHRSARPARDSGVHRRARAFHCAGRLQDGAEPARRSQLGRDRRSGCRCGARGQARNVDSRRWLSSSQVGPAAFAERRRISRTRVPEPRLTAQPSLVDSCQRPRRIRQRRSPAAGWHRPTNARSARRPDPARRPRPANRITEGARAGTGGAGARWVSRETQRRRDRRRIAPGDRTCRARMPLEGHHHVRRRRLAACYRGSVPVTGRTRQAWTAPVGDAARAQQRTGAKSGEIPDDRRGRQPSHRASHQALRRRRARLPRGLAARSLLGSPAGRAQPHRHQHRDRCPTSA